MKNIPVQNARQILIICLNSRVMKLKIFPCLRKGQGLKK